MPIFKAGSVVQLGITFWILLVCLWRVQIWGPLCYAPYWQRVYSNGVLPAGDTISMIWVR